MPAPEEQTGRIAALDDPVEDEPVRKTKRKKSSRQRARRQWQFAAAVAGLVVLVVVFVMAWQLKGTGAGKPSHSNPDTASADTKRPPRADSDGPLPPPVDDKPPPHPEDVKRPPPPDDGKRPPPPDDGKRPPPPDAPPRDRPDGMRDDAPPPPPPPADKDPKDAKPADKDPKDAMPPEKDGPPPVRDAGKIENPGTKAKEILDKAIEAQGGEQALRKVQRMIVSGQYRFPTTPQGFAPPGVTFTDTIDFANDRFRRHAVLSTPHGTETAVVVIGSAEKGWTYLKRPNSARPESREHAAAEIPMLFAEHATVMYFATLLPLREPEFKLEVATEERPEADTPVAINVSREGFPKTRLRFAKTGELKKIQWLEQEIHMVHAPPERHGMPPPTEWVKDVTLTNFGKVEGASLPKTALATSRSGKYTQEFTFSKFDTKTAISDKSFVKPN